MTALLSPMLWRALAVAAALAAMAWAYHLWADHQREIGRTEVRAEWQADRANISEQSRLLTLARDKESARLQAAVDKQREIDHAEKRALGRRVAGLLDSLRDRPERPAADQGSDNLPTASGVGPAGPGNAGCTGDRLYRDDSEALVRLGAAGDRLRIALKQCRIQYQRAEAAQSSVTPSQP